MNKKLIFIALGAVAMLLPSLAGATVSGPCVNCHTMHNSQDGTNMGSLTENDQLLKGAGCTGCHAINGVVNDASGVATTGSILAPQVDDGNQTNAAGYFTMTDVDAQQHNVADISVMTGDGALATGGSPGQGLFTTTDAGSPTLTCSGCHSNPVHHNVTTGTYRGLAPLTFTATQTDLANYGNNQNSGTPIAGIGGTSAIVYDSVAMNLVCAGCHGGFHTGANQDGSAVGLWIRHPTDISVATDAGTAPSIVPVNTGNDTDQVTVGNNGGSNDIVMCISCHASHGSPYADLLKFDYAANVAGGGTVAVGCETCHSYASSGM